MANTLENLKRILGAIKAETRVIDNHPDPCALTDCWNEVDYLIDELFTVEQVKRIAFRASELTENYKIHNPQQIAHLHTNYEQIIKNKGMVVGMPKDH